MESMAQIQKIKELKKRQNAVILAHYYEEGAIQDVADEVGDSLFLAKRGRDIKAPVLLMAGVTFMAESVKILSPEKRVLVPDTNAGCSLVHHSPYDKYLQWRKKHPRAICVSYVNSSAKVKSITDVTCTSSNAEKIINSIPEDREILFGPDRHLGTYLSRKLERPMTLWPGSCEVHVLFSARKLYELKKDNPEALILAHPECVDSVLEYADVIGSTSVLLNEVKTSQAKTFVIATESGIFHQMKKVRPEAKLIQAPVEGSCACNECPYMKLNTLEKVSNALESLEPAIELDETLVEEARIPLHRMMAITEGNNVNWPERFKYAN